ncbi:hypothetical protein pb186bvf_005572 [Paramecium bursaria]
MDKYHKMNRSAFIIQSYWMNKKKQFKPLVKVYFTSLTGQSHQIKQNLHKSQLILDQKKWNIKYIDICENKEDMALTQQYRQQGFELPHIYINEHFIGGANELQELEDFQYLDDIYTQTYLKICLNCNNDRLEKQNECDQCQKPFLFFRKN